MKKVLFCISVVSLALLSCKKDRLASTAEILKTAEDNALMEGEYNQIYEYSDRAVNYLETNKGLKAGDSLDILPPCAKIITDSILRVLTIDFGDDKCLCKDGLSRQGQIIINYDSVYTVPGSKISVRLQDYFANDTRFDGNKTIVNEGGGTYTYTVRNAKAFTAGGVISWKTDAIIKRIAGNNTPKTAFDDIYEVTGASVGVNRTGKSFTAETTIPLLRRIELGCIRNYVVGTIRLEDEDNNFLELDYDPYRNAACDKIASVNINDDFQREITLR